ncbi:MAG: hypothetical protein M1377_01805 [Deltaproteobacteria bacterium]|nr:hypothetical protein [Deltaproteobacteria bacterium]
MWIGLLVGAAAVAGASAVASQAPGTDPGHVILSLDNVLLHVLPAISAGAFAWAGARFTIQDHSRRIGRLERHNSWGRRKLEKLETVHLGRHPEDAPLLHVESINGGNSGE